MKTLRDFIAKYLGGLVYQAKHNTLGTYWNSYQEADDFMDSFGLKDVSEYEGKYIKNDFFLKMKDGTYKSINSLSTL